MTIPSRSCSSRLSYAADHDISFWAFDWYYPEVPEKQSPLNNALGLFLKRRIAGRMKFCLLVANHQGFRIGPKDWDACCQIWIDLFRQPTHLRVNDRPLLIFFSPEELQTAFGGAEGVRKAFEALQAKAREAGLPGVTIAACTSAGEHPELVKAGYSILTGYNYSNSWMDGGGGKPFQTLIDANRGILDQFAKTTPLPYVPVITIGWDRRPWEQGVYPAEKMSGWYTGRTPALVEEFVRLGVQWVNEHADKATAEKASPAVRVERERRRWISDANGGGGDGVSEGGAAGGTACGGGEVERAAPLSRSAFHSRPSRSVRTTTLCVACICVDTMA